MQTLSVVVLEAGREVFRASCEPGNTVCWGGFELRVDEVDRAGVASIAVLRSRRRPQE
jgi:hypothetical protein